MDLQHTILLLVGFLIVLGVAAAIVAWYFGRQYQSGGSKRQKYICVACCVGSCVYHYRHTNFIDVPQCTVESIFDGLVSCMQ